MKHILRFVWWFVKEVLGYFALPFLLLAWGVISVVLLFVDVWKETA